MLDELLDDPLTTDEAEDLFGGVPAAQIGDAPLLLIPRSYTTKKFDAAMSRAEKWAEENFGTSDVNLVKMGTEVLFAPSPRTPLRHQ